MSFQHISARILFALTLAPAALLFATEARGQNTSFEWTYDRPDAIAPAGVASAQVVSRPNFQIRYRFDYLSFEGSRDGGGDVIPVAEIFRQTDLNTIPVKRTQIKHEIDLLFGIADAFAIRAVVSYLDNDMDQITDTDFEFSTGARGFGDVLVEALVPIINEGSIRAHVHGGVSSPTGSISEEALFPGLASFDELAFAMQMGSGTWDLRPGATVMKMNEFGTFGAQALGTIRLGSSDRSYRLGHRFAGTVWLQPKVTDYVSFSLRVAVESWGNVETDGAVSQSDILNQSKNPELQGGTRWDLPLGLNILFPESGHRILAEALIPVSRDLDGPQLDLDWGFSLAWQKIF